MGSGGRARPADPLYNCRGFGPLSTLHPSEEVTSHGDSSLSPWGLLWAPKGPTSRLDSVVLLSDCVESRFLLFDLASFGIEHNGCDLVFALGSSLSASSRSSPHNTALVEGDEASDTSNGNGLAFVAQGEATQRCAVVHLLDRDGRLCANVDEAASVRARELGVLFLDFLAVLVKLVRILDLLDGDVVSVRV